MMMIPYHSGNRIVSDALSIACLYCMYSIYCICLLHLQGGSKVETTVFDPASVFLSTH